MTGILYKNKQVLLYGAWEDLEYFVEKLKRLNKEETDRRQFKIYGISGALIKEWNRS